MTRAKTLEDLRREVMYEKQVISTKAEWDSTKALCHSMGMEDKMLDATYEEYVARVEKQNRRFA